MSEQLLVSVADLNFSLSKIITQYIEDEVFIEMLG